MTIETKYNIGDEVWFMEDNAAVYGDVANIKIEVYNHIYSTNPIPFIIEPATTKIEVRCKVTYEVNYEGTNKKLERCEEKLFPTKEELLKSL